ncbi:MAG: hypothetical protein P0S96_05070 [Simkaniaceae bacterium]|nr:hypothetical protein [Candidatus Sacchlamyda saccharinae]
MNLSANSISILAPSFYDLSSGAFHQYFLILISNRLLKSHQKSEAMLNKIIYG